MHQLRWRIVGPDSSCEPTLSYVRLQLIWYSDTLKSQQPALAFDVLTSPFNEFQAM